MPVLFEHIQRHQPQDLLIQVRDFNEQWIKLLLCSVIIMKDSDYNSFNTMILMSLMLRFLLVYSYQGTMYFVCVIAKMYLWWLHKHNSEGIWVETCWNYFVSWGWRWVGGNLGHQIFGHTRKDDLILSCIWMISFAIQIQFDSIFPAACTDLMQAGFAQRHSSKTPCVNGCVLNESFSSKIKFFYDICEGFHSSW